MTPESIFEVLVTELLLPTKLYKPQIRPGLVTRPRLTSQLHTGLTGKLTILSAPAGFGKTTLLGEWINQYESDQENGVGAASQPSAFSRPNFAWLSLDEHDNDPARFMLYLIAALQTAAASLGQSALAQLQSGQPLPAETTLTILINDLTLLDSQLGLILDDYHLISNPVIHTAVAFFLEHAPSQFHLIIASRSDPPLALSRWRVRGELNEIRATDLRFTASETAQFLQHALGHSLDAAATDLLAQRTEGWIAGLQLAALSLRGLDAAAASQFLTEFGGTHRHIFTYLIEEVLQRHPPLVQQFLLQTTLLDRLTPALCDAVTGIKAWPIEAGLDLQPPLPSLQSQFILDYMAQNNLFLIALDESGQWFRYHTLFAETVQTHLQKTQPDLIPDLHRRAAYWYAAHGYTEQAIRHAQAIPDNDMAADLIDAAANHLWLQGHLGVLLAWLKGLPEQLLASRLRLLLLHAWLLFLHDQWAEAGHRVHLAGQQLAALPPDDPETHRYYGHWAAIQGAMAAHRQEVAAAITWMETALQNLPADDVHWRQVAMIGLGLAQLADGQARAAITTLHQAALVCERLDDLYLAFAAWSHQIEACWAQGRLHEAAACLHRLELLAERDEGNWLALPAYAAIGRGVLAYERNELAQAQQLISTALPQIWPGGQPRVVLTAYLTLARVAQAQGYPERMHQYLDAAAQLVHRFNLTVEQRLLAAVTARLLLAEGDLFDAFWQLENEEINAESPADFGHEMGLLTLVRLYLAEGRTPEAMIILARLLPPAESAGRDGSQLEIFLLQALAFAQHHQHDHALACLHHALALAEPEQFSRIFLNEGRPLAQLLRQITPPTPYVTHLLAQMSGPLPANSWLEPLTSREREILSLVAAGASNQTIADHLVISLGTVKGHLNHILSKLEAHNRTEAVARGRELGLL